MEAEINNKLGKSYADAYEAGGFESYFAGLNARAARTLAALAADGGGVEGEQRQREQQGQADEIGES